MAFTVPLFSLPCALTVAIWIVALIWPTGPKGGDYNFGPALKGAFHGLLAIIGTLVVWLVFFVFLSVQP